MWISAGKEADRMAVMTTEEKKTGIVPEKQTGSLPKMAVGLGTPADFTSPETLIDELKSRVLRYHPSDDLSMIEKAVEVAERAHSGQMRKSGEPYIIHPLCVGIILADLEMDKETIAAGILHDVVEDTAMTVEEIRGTFGDDVALLVDGVTKLGQVDYKVEKVEIQAENLR